MTSSSDPIGRVADAPRSKPATEASRETLAAHPAGPIADLAAGTLYDPFTVLGRHPHAPSPSASGHRWVLREHLPQAEQAWIVDPAGDATPLSRIPNSDVFVLDDLPAALAPPAPYRVRWVEKRDGSTHEVVSPWSFGPQLDDGFLARFSAGAADDAHHHLGAHPVTVDGVPGVRFAVWVPGVPRVSVVGDFNGWHGLRHPMRNRGASGVWELFVPGLGPGDRYKYEIRTRDGRVLLKADPYARQAERRPDTASVVAAPIDAATFDDADWTAARRGHDWLHAPMSIYEVHPGSWRRTESGEFYDWERLAAELIPYVVERGFTHIELMPIFAHPLDQSWGYQVTGFFAPSARFGPPVAFARFVGAAHRAGLGVILDWVPAHFPKDDWALARFTGEPTYEHPDPLRGEHPDWGTLVFDYGRPEVQSFLRSSARHWIETYHVDGLRVDAVASMLYLDYSRDQWRPNARGGREHDEAIALIQTINRDIHRDFPGVVTIAEESTAWPGVSRPIETGGLGFSMKWNMGWMHDSLRYFSRDPVHRRHHHDDLTFAQLYAYHENFILPLSHDEVVHGKRSLLAKMHGDDAQRFAHLRLLLAWQALHPGKTLLFMGAELAMDQEWSEGRALDWWRLDPHAVGDVTAQRVAGVDRLIAALNHLVRQQPALHRYDFESRGFQWIDVHAADESVLSFLRRGDDTDAPVVCVLNATPVARHWRLALPHAGPWQEQMNTDASDYGGDNRGNLGRVEAEPRPHHGWPASADVFLPPLAALVFVPESA